MSALAPALFSEYREDTRWTEAREWHHLEQDWHQQEVDWRSVDVEWRGEQRRRMALEQDWRDMDMHQRWLDNLRREVDEKVQQLATLSNLSALLAGFAIVALVELSIPEETAVGVVIALACCTAIVVTATVLSMVTAAFVMVGLLKKYRGTKPLFEAAELGSDAHNRTQTRINRTDIHRRTHRRTQTHSDTHRHRHRHRDLYTG